MWPYYVGIIVLIGFVIYILSNQGKNNKGISQEEAKVESEAENKTEVMTAIDKNISSNQTKKEEYIRAKENMKRYDNNYKNRVAAKFEELVSAIKVFGYLAAIVVAIMYMANDEPLVGIGYGIGIAVGVFFSTLIYEALAEIINLLQDIKNMNIKK